MTHTTPTAPKAQARNAAPVIHRVRVPVIINPVETVTVPKGAKFLSSAPARGVESDAIDLWYLTRPGVQETETWTVFMVPTGSPIPPVPCQFLTTMVQSPERVSHLFLIGAHA